MSKIKNKDYPICILCGEELNYKNECTKCITKFMYPKNNREFARSLYHFAILHHRYGNNVSRETLTGKE